MSLGYNADDITTLSFKDGMQKRTEMYIGDRGPKGIMHVYYEILTNSNDEALNGYGTRIITRKKGDTISVQDFGRGIPIGVNEEGLDIMEAVFTIPHTGGKFDNRVYNSSGGLNGIGAKTAYFTAGKFKATTIRDGKRQTITATEGEKDEIITEDFESEQTGTTVTYSPSYEIFRMKKFKFNFDEILVMNQVVSYSFPNVVYEVIDDDTGERVEISSPNGMADLLKNNVKNRLTDTILSSKTTDGTTEVEVFLTWSKEKEESWCFVNGVKMPDGGTPIIGMKNAITRTMNSLLGVSLPGDQARIGASYVASVRIQEPSFSNQTKTEIGNTELRSMAGGITSEMIRTFFATMPTEAGKVSNRVLLEKKAQEAADKERAAIFANAEMVKEKKKGTQPLAGKLLDCTIHDEHSRILLVEGDSAGGNVGNARNSDDTAVLPLGGKIINALKHTTDKVLMSERIVDIQTALGCGIGKDFDIKKLKYGHVGILADADQDGFSILCLVLTFFYRYMPELLIQEKVAFYSSPLFKVTTPAGKVHYAFSPEELDDLPNGEITRIKGIGELQADDLAVTTLSDDRKHVTFFTIEDAEEAGYYFEMFMGPEVEGRAEYIAENVDFSEIIE